MKSVSALYCLVVVRIVYVDVTGNLKLISVTYSDFFYYQSFVVFV